MSINDMNAREQLEAAMNWLAWHHEDLNYGLKSAEDGLKLWRYWMARPELPEFCEFDSSETEAETKQRMRHVRAAIGYDPWKRCHEIEAAL